jgi:hypothetical protein
MIIAKPLHGGFAKRHRRIRNNGHDYDLEAVQNRNHRRQRIRAGVKNGKDNHEKKRLEGQIQ